MQQMVTLHMTKEQIETVKNEIKKIKHLEALNGVKKPRELKTFKRKIRKANAKYGVQKPLRGARKVGLQIWAMIWLGIFTIRDRLAEINREQ